VSSSVGGDGGGKGGGSRSGGSIKSMGECWS